MRISFQLWRVILLAWLAANLPLQAAELKQHFDDPQSVAAAGLSGKVTFCPDYKVSGNGCARIECLLDSNGTALRLPANFTQGVGTFWLFDPFSNGVNHGRMRVGFRMECARLDNGKPVPVELALYQGNTAINWALHDLRMPREQHGRDLYVMRHPGWTRFDIVNPAGSDPQHFLIYIDGRLAGQTPEKLVSLNALIPANFWGHGYVYIDEFSFHDDPNTFVPAVVQDFLLADEAGNVAIQAGQKLRLNLALAGTGVRGAGGFIDVKLQDGAEGEVASLSVPLSRAQAAAGELMTELPCPPHSGQYWVVANYRDGQGTLPLHLRKKWNIQFLTPEQMKSGQTSLVLARAWDWLPFGERTPPGDDIAAPKEIPAQPPTDWTGAVPMKGAWYHYSFMNREFPYQAGWYRRKVTVPAAWTGKKILLRIDDPQSLAAAFVNGKNVGEIAWPGGELDLTTHLVPGSTVELALFVRAEKMAGYNQVLRDILGDAFTPDEKMSMRGLRGEVALIGRGHDAAVDHTRIRTFANQGAKNIEVTFSFRNLSAGQKYRVGGTVSAAGLEALRLPEQEFVAGDAGQTVTVSAPWPNPQLWDLRQPFLYDFNAVLTDAAGTSVAAAPERFGFRDIGFAGRFVKLNGRTVNFFHGGVLVNFPNWGFADFLNKYNLNFIGGEHLHYALYPGGSLGAMSDHAGFCDNAGVGTYLNLSHAPRLKALTAFNKEDDQRYWDYYQKTASYFIRKYDNSPSVFFWGGVGGGNSLDMGAMYNPFLQDGIWQRDNSENPVLARYRKAAVREQAVLRAADPARRIVAQDSGNFNDVCHITQYAGFMPAQELMEMNRYWIENGVKPIFYSEQAAPFSLNWFNNPRAGGHGTKRAITYESEWCAITRGDKAFIRAEIDDDILRRYEKLSQDRFEQIYKIENKANRDKALTEYSNRNVGPSFPTCLYNFDTDSMRNELWRERIREQFLNWRADGIGLLCVSYNDDLGQTAYDAYAQCFRPVTGFLAGAPQSRYDRTHIYAPGEELKRGLILLSNAAKPRKLRYEWQLDLAGKSVARKTEVVEIPAGETMHLPINARIDATRDCTGTLSLKVTDISGKNPEDVAADHAEITVLAGRDGAVGTTARVALVDPEGASATALKNAGIAFQRVPFNADLTAYDLVIFGRRAFVYELDNTPEGIDLDLLTRAGKRVLILEQDEKTLRERFRLRTEYASSRQVFTRDTSGVLTRGLSDDSLGYWRGEATLTDGYAVARAQLSPRRSEMNGGRWFYEWNDGREHTRPMKWGNRHNVATVVVAKPDTGNFRTLVDCEFALNYAAVWQLLNGAGQIVFSQIDCSDRTEVGPEALRFLQNLVQYSLAPSLPQSREAVYLGGKHGGDLLTGMFVPFTSVNDPAKADAERNVLIVGDATAQELLQWKEGLRRFAEHGGVIFSLPKPADILAAAWTPVPLSTEGRVINRTSITGIADPLLAGLGNSDFYWKGNLQVTAFKKLAGADLQLDTGILARVRQGQGQWIFCQISPELFTRNPDYFWLQDSQRYTTRTLRTLLCNAGVRMSPPQFLSSPRAAQERLGALSLTGGWLCVKATTDAPAQAMPGAESGWKPLAIPGSFRTAYPEWAEVKGGIWFRRTFNFVPVPGSTVRLTLGAVAGADRTFVNGHEVGRTTMETNPNDLSTACRVYTVPEQALKSGSNELAVFVAFDTRAALSPGDGNLRPPLMLETFREKAGGKLPDPISLDGWWAGFAMKGKDDIPANETKGWHRIKVPGEWETQHAHWSRHDGYFWYRRTFVLTGSLPDGAQPVLFLGAVDDEDDTYLNGKLIGHTAEDTNPRDYWMAERTYRIPAGLLKVGENTITVRVNDLRGGGGIVENVRLLFEDPALTLKRKLAQSPYLFDVGTADDPYMYCGW